MLLSGRRTNSSVALEYPERRPYFEVRECYDIVQYTTGAFLFEINKQPTNFNKTDKSGKKKKSIFLTALDQNSLYQIAGEDRSYLWTR